MRFARQFALIGLLVVSSCGGSASTASTESSAAQTVPAATEKVPDSQAPETLPALVDASTDIDAIDMPVVLWFWSPG